MRTSALLFGLAVLCMTAFATLYTEELMEPSEYAFVETQAKTSEFKICFKPSEFPVTPSTAQKVIWVFDIGSSALKGGLYQSVHPFTKILLKTNKKDFSPELKFSCFEGTDEDDAGLAAVAVQAGTSALCPKLKMADSNQNVVTKVAGKEKKVKNFVDIADVGLETAQKQALEQIQVFYGTFLGKYSTVADASNLPAPMTAGMRIIPQIQYNTIQKIFCGMGLKDANGKLMDGFNIAQSKNDCGVISGTKEAWFEHRAAFKTKREAPKEKTILLTLGGASAQMSIVLAPGKDTTAWKDFTKTLKKVWNPHFKPGRLCQFETKKKGEWRDAFVADHVEAESPNVVGLLSFLTFGRDPHKIAPAKGFNVGGLDKMETAANEFVGCKSWLDLQKKPPIKASLTAKWAECSSEIKALFSGNPFWQETKKFLAKLDGYQVDLGNVSASPGLISKGKTGPVAALHAEDESIILNKEDESKNYATLRTYITNHCGKGDMPDAFKLPYTNCIRGQIIYEWGQIFKKAKKTMMAPREDEVDWPEAVAPTFESPSTFKLLTENPESPFKAGSFVQVGSHQLRFRPEPVNYLDGYIHEKHGSK